MPKSRPRLTSALLALAAIGALAPRGFAQPVEGGADVLVPGYDRPAP